MVDNQRAKPDAATTLAGCVVHLTFLPTGVVHTKDPHHLPCLVCGLNTLLNARPLPMRGLLGGLIKLASVHCGGNGQVPLQSAAGMHNKASRPTSGGIRRCVVLTRTALLAARRHLAANAPGARGHHARLIAAGRMATIHMCECGRRVAVAIEKGLWKCIGNFLMPFPTTPRPNTRASSSSGLWMCQFVGIAMPFELGQAS